ncbi:MAG: CU044_2847 family protein [Xenococcus sp. (in: cyanobacteria)]
MATGLIKLEDCILVEVEVPETRQIAGSGGIYRSFQKTLDMIQPVLVSVSNAVTTTWKELNHNVDVEQAEINFGLCFGAEGNVYITKSTIEANLAVKLVLKPKKEV